jgi:DNA polymerase
VDLHIDLETVAVVDLRRTGVYRYAEDRHTDVIVAWLHCPQTGEWEEWRPGRPVPGLVKRAIVEGWTIHAWNAQFEFVLWSCVLGPRHGWPVPKLAQMDCTMARAMYWGWPASLDTAAVAMGLAVQKDQEGYSLMLRMCRPRAFNEDGAPRWWHQEDQAKYDRLSAYCKTDVATEVAAGALLPPLPPTERKLWLLDQRMNAKGLPVDTGLVDVMSRVAADAEARLKAEMKALTGGAVSGPTAHAALSTWLTNHCVVLPDLRADTLRAVLRDKTKVLTPTVREVLQLRLDGAKASVAKLKAFKEAVCADGHVKGMLRYYGANRTGRWSGAGGAKVQPHNIVRGTIKRPDLAIEAMLNGADAEGVELAFEDGALGVIASCLRGVFACR